ncbi:hypothetical protein HDU96_008697 [Phlyctochytrium bullatum]|nr:hypothetical protein HDU96_008697 [Phlyctochytrium bullatum]
MQQPYSYASIKPNPHSESHVSGLDSLPVELARRILLNLYPADLLRLAGVSRAIRRLYVPADTEVQFAVNHFVALVPKLLDFSDGYNGTHNNMKDVGNVRNDESESDDSDIDNISEGTDAGGSDDDNVIEDGHAGGEDIDGNINNSLSNIDDGRPHFDVSGGSNNGDSESNDSGDPSEHYWSEENSYEASFDPEKEELLNAITVIQRQAKRFQRLPLCYALAVLKEGSFEEYCIYAITRTDKGQFWELKGKEKRRQMAFLRRVLVTAVCELGMGFEEAEYEWEGRWFRRKEAYYEVRMCIGMTGSIKAARYVIKKENNSVTMLPPGRAGKHKRPWQRRSTLKGDGDPTDVSETIQELARTACHYGTVPLLPFLFETYPTSFMNLSTFYAENYLHSAFSCRHEEMMRMLVDYMNRIPNGKEPFAADPTPKYNPLLSKTRGIIEVSLLQAATSDGDAPMVRLLLELGADPNFVATGVRYLHGNGDGHDIEESIGPCDDDPALHIACNNRNLELIPLLIAHGADPLTLSNAGLTPLLSCRDAGAASALLSAVEQHAPHAMQDLLAAQDPFKDNALHRAIEDKKVELVRFLLEAIQKADRTENGLAMKKTVFGTKGKLKLTVLLMACSLDDSDALMVLNVMMEGVERDTSAFEEMRRLLLIDDGEGFTPVHAAAKFAHEATLRKIVKVLSAVDDGMCKKVLGMKGGVERQTPLRFAANNRRENSACVKMLVEHEALLFFGDTVDGCEA